MLLVCLLLSLIHLLSKSISKQAESSFSKTERLKRRVVLAKYWMNLFLSLPKLMRSSPFGDLLEVWIHFSLFVIQKCYLNEIFTSLLFLEFGSTFSSSFIEGSEINCSPFFSSDIIKYVIFYIIDGLMMCFLNINFVGIAVLIYHCIFSLLIISKHLKWRVKWKIFDFGDSNIISITDLGIIDDCHTILCQYPQSLDIISIQQNKNIPSDYIYKRISEVSCCYTYEVKKYYPLENIIVLVETTLDQTTETTTILTLSIPSLTVLNTSENTIVMNQHYILNDSTPTLAVFETSKDTNSSKIKIFNLMGFNHQYQRFEQLQAFNLNEYFESNQIKLFISIDEFQTENMEKMNKANHVIKVLNKTVWDINTSKKKATELTEYAPEIIHSVEKMNNRVIALCAKWRIIIYDIPAQIKVRKIDCLHSSSSLLQVKNQEDAYIALPPQSIQSRKFPYILKNQLKNNFQVIDTLLISDPSLIYSASYWSQDNSLSLVIGTKFFLKTNASHITSQAEAQLDFSICVSSE